MIFSLIALSAFVKAQSKKDINAIIDLLENYRYVAAQRSGPKDVLSHLIVTEKKNEKHLVVNIPSTVFDISDSTKAFYMSDHEVTNAEYRAFVDDVKSSLRKDGKLTSDTSVYYSFSMNNQSFRINIYPDTSCWLKDYALHMGDPMMEYYWKHPAFDNYPVVGVNWYQAQAYVDWLTKQFSETLKDHDISLPSWGKFRLPTKKEWEASTKSHFDPYEGIQYKLYAWKGRHYLSNSAEYLGNFGPEYNNNGLLLKEYSDDGFVYSAPIKSFPPTDMGLFELSGNVAEWTSSSYHKDSVAKSYAKWYYEGFSKSFPDLRLELEKDNPNWELINKTIEEKSMKAPSQAIWYNPKNDAENMSASHFYAMYNLENIKAQEVHNLKAIDASPNHAITKGGSWASPAICLLNTSDEVYSKDRGYSTVGFRVILTLDENLKMLLGEKFQQQATKPVQYKAETHKTEAPFNIENN